MVLISSDLNEGFYCTANKPDKENQEVYLKWCVNSYECNVVLYKHCLVF